MFALVVRFEIKAGCVDAFDRLVEQTIGAIRASEDGTFLYVSSQVDGSPTSRVFIEIYRDRRAFDDHEAHEHTQAFLREREALIESYRVEFLTPVGGMLPFT